MGNRGRLSEMGRFAGSKRRVSARKRKRRARDKEEPTQSHVKGGWVRRMGGGGRSRGGVEIEGGGRGGGTGTEMTMIDGKTQSCNNRL